MSLHTCVNVDLPDLTEGHVTRESSNYHQLRITREIIKLVVLTDGHVTRESTNYHQLRITRGIIHTTSNLYAVLYSPGILIPSQQLICL